MRRIVLSVAVLVAGGHVWAQCAPDAVAPGTWCQMPNTSLRSFVNSVLENDNPNSAPYLYNIRTSDPLSCQDGAASKDLSNVMVAWNGGAFDPTHQELLIHGGGHSDSCDNSVYGFNLEQRAWRLVADATAASERDFVSSTTNTTYSDGTPASSHSYDLLEYVPSLGAFCTVGIKVGYSSDGNHCDRHIYCQDVQSMGYGSGRGWWTAGLRPWEPGQNITDSVAYDRRYGRVWNHGMPTSSGKPGCGAAPAQPKPFYWDGWNAVDPGASSDPSGDSTSGTSTFNPVKQLLYRAGGGLWDSPNSSLTVWNVAQSPPTKINLCGTYGLCLPSARTGPGLEWNQQIQRVTAWLGGSTVYVLDDTASNPASWSWNSCQLSGGAPSRLSNGTYGRFRYSHKHNVYVLDNGVDSDIWLGKLPVSPGCGRAQNDNDIRPELLEAEVPGYQTAGVRLVYGGDTNQNAGVSVRYRLASGGPWVAYLDMYRTEEASQSELVPPAGHPIPNEFATILYGLAPNTKYEVEATISDPDGYAETQSIMLRTRGEPPANPSSPTIVNVSSLAQLRSAIGNAQPGHVIVLAPGVYRAGTGDRQVINIAGLRGTAANPIFLRGTNRATTILDANGESQVLVSSGLAEYVTIEDLTLRGMAPSEEAALDIEKARGVVIRRNAIEVQGSGISVGEWSYSRENWIEGNLIGGPAAFPDVSNAVWDYAGIVIHGRGNVIKNNTIYGAGDALNFGKAKGALDWPGDQSPIRGNELFLNDILWYGDDCIEFDGAEGNNIAYMNRCMNGGNCISWQPAYGSPNLALRNICWNHQSRSGLKPATAGGSATLGVVAYHNLFSLPWTSYNCKAYGTDLRNNLWVGPTDPAKRKTANIVDASTDFCGVYGSTNNDACEANCNDPGTIDYNAFSYDNTIRYNDQGYSSLAQLRASTTWDQHSIILTPAPSDTIDVFADGANIVANDTSGCSSASGCGPNWPYHEPIDARLKAGVDGIDAGVVLPGINNGYLGAAPDIGPIEFGHALPPYGADGVTVEPPDPPSPPTALTASGVDDDRIALAWGAPTDPAGGIAFYNIYRDDLRVGQSAARSYTDSGLDPQTSYSYEVTAVSNVGLESVRSSPAVGTTLADTTPPSIASVVAGGDPNEVVVVFSEPVEQSTATVAANYSIDNSIVVQSATLMPDLVTVVLATTLHVENVTYSLTVNGVRDRAPSPNTILPNSSATYVYTAALTLSNLIVASGKPYQIVEGLADGQAAYIDRSLVYGQVPGYLQGATYIRTANDDKLSDGNTTWLQFTVNRDVTVYVAHDDRYGTKPAWLTSFTDSGDNVILDTTLSLFQRDFQKGTVVLGGNVDPSEAEGNNMYTVILVGTVVTPTDPPPPPANLTVR